MGRNIRSCYLVMSKFLIKKEIFLLLETKPDFSSLIPWLHLNEILSRECYIDCSTKVYRYFSNLILYDPEFCEKRDRGYILSTPNNILRLRYSLHKSRVKDDVVEEVLALIKNCFSKGFTFDGKNVKGIAAAGYYYYSKKNGLRKSQDDIATQFSTTSVTLRSRLSELKDLLPSEEESKPKSTPESSQVKKVGNIKGRFSNKKDIIIDLAVIIEDVVKSYGDYYKLRNFMKTDYNQDIKERIVTIKKAYKELHYSDFDDDKILKDLYKKQNKKDRIIQRIETVAIKNRISHFIQITDLFIIMIFIQDFALGGTADDIAEIFSVGPSSIRHTARYIFRDPSLYASRFYTTRNLKKDIISIADDINKGKIRLSSFKHLSHPQFQELLKFYRNENDISIRASVFDLAKVSLTFAKWVYGLKDADLEEILKDYPNKLSISEFMILISEINKNLEILKCLVYNLFTESSFEYIAEITGRSLNLVLKYEQLVFKERIGEKSLAC